MFRKILLAAALITFVAAPAMAAATTYYVSQDQTTHKCYVVKKIGKNGMQIGTTGYPTKVKARAALKAAPECKPKA
jgi:uncharacterized membrane protein